MGSQHPAHLGKMQKIWRTLFSGVANPFGQLARLF
jgi:hypothetical protein